MVHWRKFFLGGGGGGEVVKINYLRKIFLGLVATNAEKSAKFVSAPLIFSFRYAHAWGGGENKKTAPFGSFAPTAEEFLKNLLRV
jgi:hypothetical protein